MLKILLLLAAGTLSAQNLEWSKFESTASKPTPRFDGTISYNSQDRKLYLFGGTDETGDVNDLWSFDFGTSTWTKLQPGGTLPRPRHGHTLNYDARRNHLLVVSGQANSLFGDVWAYDVAANSWRELSPTGAGPSARYGHSVVLDAKRDRLILSHGFTSERGRFDDTWAFDLNTRRWSNITPTGAKPLRRCLHHAVISAARDEMYLYGGCSSGAGPCPQGDLWILDLARNEWREAPLGNRPPGRQWYGITFDDARQRLVLFGGSGNGQLGDAWEFDPARAAWSMLDAAGAKPSARQRLQGAYGEGVGNLFFGGIVQQSTNELWRLGAPLAVQPTAPSIARDGVRGVFEGSPGPFAVNEIVSVYGSELAAGDGRAAVTVDGIDARVFFASKTQINFLIPAELQGRSMARVRVSHSGRLSEEQAIELRDAAPKFYPGMIRVENILVLYGTGSGVLPLSATAQVNGERADLLYAGAAPGFLGLSQFNVRIPDAQSAAAQFRVRIEIGAAAGEVLLTPQ